jgi:hypothetical protein
MMNYHLKLRESCARVCEREEMECLNYGKKLWSHIFLKLNEILTLSCDCGGENVAINM